MAAGIAAQVAATSVVSAKTLKAIIYVDAVTRTYLSDENVINKFLPHQNCHVAVLDGNLFPLIPHYIKLPIFNLEVLVAIYSYIF